MLAQPAETSTCAADAIKPMFFERRYAGWCAISDGGLASRRPLAFLDRMVHWQFEFWADNFPAAHMKT